MRKIMTNRIGKAWLGVFSMVLVLAIGLFVEQFSMVSYAQSQGKVTATSAKIRKEPSATSEVLGSAAKDDSVTINHQTTGSDGSTWYQVFVNAETLGYIRSDLVSITDGSTPTTVANTTTAQTPTATQAPAATQAPTANETPAEVTAVAPTSATVTGGENVRIRGNASTTSQIVTTVANGAALTVTGQANGSDGKVWYQVAFISNGADVTGFIRSDFVNLSGEIVPAGTTTEAPTATETPVEEVEEPKEVKKWETQFQGDKWYLLDMETPGQYAIDDLFGAIDQNGAAYDASQDTVKSQKVAIIILVIIIVILSAALAFLIFKVKDMADAAYFSEVERETMRRKNGDRVQGGQRVMHTVGAERRPASGGQGGRPAQSQGMRPERPQGGRPVQPQGERPERPMGSRPVQPQGERLQGSRPVIPQSERTVESRPTQPQQSAGQNPGRKSKNFMTDDEFEFEFLNWDGDEE